MCCTPSGHGHTWPQTDGAERKQSQERPPDDLAEILPANPIPLPVDTTESSDPTDLAPPDFVVLDTYPLAVAMLTQFWGGEHDEMVQAYADMFRQSNDAVLKKMSAGFDDAAAALLKKSALPELPAIEEWTAARDRGADALAALIVKRTPGQLTEIGVTAAMHGAEIFLAALLKHGLNPKAANTQGQTTLDAAERHGKDSAIYRMVKAAEER